jgi:hypothetical protein
MYTEDHLDDVCFVLQLDDGTQLLGEMTTEWN